jgi:spore coat polysaccharide biosynthesis protein SpsF
MKVVAIIQARMGSTRLPGKVLKDIGGQSMLARVVRRVQRATLLDLVVVATTVESSDDVIVAECRHLGVAVFRGDEKDVLGRYHQAAKEYGAEVIVRITADCPLIDPEVVDRVVRAFFDEQPDCASNTLVRTYPRGLGFSVITMAALTRAYQEAHEPHHRTHVPLYIHQNPDSFRLLAVTGQTDYSHHRWTVDTPEDLAFVQEIYARFGNSDTFGWRDVLAILDREPELMELNCHVEQKHLKDC